MEGKINTKEAHKPGLVVQTLNPAPGGQKQADQASHQPWELLLSPGLLRHPQAGAHTPDNHTQNLKINSILNPTPIPKK